MAGKRISRLESKRDVHNYPILMDILPPGYEYFIETFNKNEEHEGEERFSTTFRLARSEATKDKMKQWLKEFCNQSLTTFRIERTYPSETKWFMYRVDLRCHHNTKPSSHKNRINKPHKKHTACQAKMSIKIRQDKLSKRKRNDLYLKTYPVEVALFHLHNHLIQKKDALQFRDPDTGLVEKFRRMYHAGYKPAAALEIHKRDLQMEYEDDFRVAVEDRALCPDINWCYRQYYLAVKEKKVNQVTDNKISALKEFINEYNKDCNEKCAAIKLLNDDSDNVVLALATPLMKCIHEDLSETGKLIFIDSWEMEFFRYSIYLLLTHSGVGGLPVGVLITSSDCSDVLLEAFNLYTDLLPERAFAGRGSLGPEVIMTEDCHIQQNILTAKFPYTSIVICPYHVIQDTWQKLHSSQADIEPANRQDLFSLVKDMIEAQTIFGLEGKYKKLIALPHVQNSKFLFSHLEDLYKRRYEWSLCLRDDLMNKIGSLANVDAMVEVLKDKVLSQSRTYTMVQLLKYLTNDLDTYYEKKLKFLTEDQFQMAFLQRYMQNKKMMGTLEIVPYFKVRNVANGECFDIDLSLGLCSCSVGVLGEPCKHQCALIQKISIGSFMSDPILNSKTKDQLKRIFSERSNKCDKYNKTCNKKFNDLDNPDERLEVSDVTVLCKKLKVSKTVDKKEKSYGKQMVLCSDPIKDSFNCLICSKVFSSQKDLSKHEVIHNHEPPIVCKVNERGSSEKGELGLHCLDAHAKERPFKSDICGKSFTEKLALTKHLLIHSKKKFYSCETCGKLFRSSECVTKHQLRHAKEKQFDNESERGLGTQMPHVLKTFETDIPIQLKDVSDTFNQHEELKVIIINAEETQLPSTITTVYEKTACSFQEPSTKIRPSLIPKIAEGYPASSTQLIQTVQVYTQTASGNTRNQSKGSSQQCSDHLSHLEKAQIGHHEDTQDIEDD